MIRKLFFLYGATPDDGDGGDGDGDGGAGDGTPEDDPKPKIRELTDDEMTRMTAQAADKASRKTKKEIASTLGFDSMKDLNEFVESRKEADDAALDEQTKAIQDAERKGKEADARMSDLSDKSLLLDISQQVLNAGVADPAKARRVAALVRDDLDSESLEDEGTWEQSITVALQSVKDDMPELFVKAGFGGGDGGAHGESEDEQTDEQKEAAATKKIRDEYEAKGLIYHPIE